MQMRCNISQTKYASCSCNFEGRNTITSSHYRVSSNRTKYWSSMENVELIFKTIKLLNPFRIISWVLDFDAVIFKLIPIVFDYSYWWKIYYLFLAQFLYLLTEQLINGYSTAPIQVRNVLRLWFMFLHFTWLRMEKVRRNVGSHCKVNLD